MAGDDTLTEREVWLPEPVQLFRFSALTWNGHRIHYDLQHCRETEHYPDLITHGPFTGMMLANLTPEGVSFIPAFNKSYIEATLGRTPEIRDQIRPQFQNQKYVITEVQEDSFEMYGVYHIVCTTKLLREDEETHNQPLTDRADTVGGHLEGYDD